MAELRVYPQGFRELASSLGGIEISRVLVTPDGARARTFPIVTGYVPRKG